MADLLALSSLLKDCSREEEDRAAVQAPAFTPGSIGPAIQAGPVRSKQEKEEGGKSIWGEAEVPEEGEVEDVNDGRPVPRYEFYYKQMVGTEDVFLGMSDKTPSSNDCTHIVVKIHFPGCKMSDLDLDVSKRKLRAESPKLRLSTYLPLPVDSDNGSAKFDSKKQLLIVTLPIVVDEL